MSKPSDLKIDSKTLIAHVPPLSPEEEAALDPGIRKMVKWMRQLGYDTTDSGDGVSKFNKLAAHPNDPDEAPEGVIDTPHVIIQLDYGEWNRESLSFQEIAHHLWEQIMQRREVNKLVSAVHLVDNLQVTIGYTLPWHTLTLEVFGIDDSCLFTPGEEPDEKSMRIVNF